MRIDPKSNIEGIYEANLKKNQTVSGNSTGNEKDNNVDRVEISFNVEDYDELSSVKESVVNDVQQGASPDKLRSLKMQIENGTYHVSSQDIANAMMNSVTGSGGGTEDE